MEKVTYDEVHELFDYDPATGILTNKTSRRKARKGKMAGHPGGHGHLQIGVKGKKYLAHQLAWLYHYGYFPEHGLDHINRIKTDNRIVNLREATQSCNMKNSGIQSNNTSGIKGVYWRKDAHKWLASIQDKNHKLIYLGIFSSKLDAAKARHTAEIKHGYPDCQMQSTALNYIQREKG